MTNETSAQSASTKKPRSNKRLVAIIAASVLVVAGGITAVSVSAAKASADETVRQCAVALDQERSAATTATQSTAAADKALAAVKTTTLPKGAGTSAAYAQRPAAKAGKGTSARVSGADFIGAVTGARTALVKITVSTQCADRDQAGAIQAATAKKNTAAKTLDTSIQALQADFAVFQTDETKRIAAEKKAAAEKAAAAKKKAEAEAAAKKKAAAAAQAAQEAAAAQAAQAPAQDTPAYVAPQPAADDGNYAPAPAPYVPAPAPYVPAPAPAPYVPAPAPVRNPGSSGTPGGGGGGVISGGGGGGKVCWTSNGKGGMMPC